ncbi:dipeptidyl aminopeptidase, partial [Kitasatospora purpeofusca]
MLVAVDGLYDLGETSVRNIPGLRVEVEGLLRVSSAPGLDVVFEVVVAKDPVACWVIGRGMY